MASVSLRIAIADDDRASREVLRELLRSLGHTVIAVAENGRSLIEACAKLRPDVVITDNLMPDISGAEAAAIIYRQHPTQIILLSAFCDRDLIIAAEQKPILMYLVKPLNAKHLEVALHRCCEVLGEQQAQEDDDSGAELNQPSFSGKQSVGGTLVRPPPRPPYDQGRLRR